MEEPFYKQTTLPHLITDEANSPLPSYIGPYKIESLLSAGGMSLLYLGLHPETHTPIAVKVLSPKYVSKQEVIEQFLNEAEIIALTDHSNIVKLYGQGQWEKGLYIAMEFIQGVSLRQFIVQNSLSLRRALDILLQVAYALLHLHTHGVIHRDLKPENILITESGQVKVIDFGIAQVIAKEAEKTLKGLSGGVIGTPSYMSPEQRKNPSSVGITTDIYALGIIAYELISGKLSFGHIQLTLLPNTLRPIIEEALRPDPSERTQDIVDFITSISAYLKSNAIKNEAPGKMEINEIWDNLNQTQTQLLPPKLTLGPNFDIGLSRPENALLFGLYYDFFKFPDGNAHILLAESTQNSADAICYISNLRGMIRALMTPYITDLKHSFSHVQFVNELNTLVAQDSVKETFGLSSLHINTNKDSFSFISAGETPLWHITQTRADPRLLLNHDPLLGENPNHYFDETSDNWFEGDTLLFHSFNHFFCSEKETANLEEEYRKALYKYRDLSCQNQADSIYKHMSNAIQGPAEKQPKALLCIQRV
ncbi:MAG: protein kinase [Simkaniaceae bacterium]